MKRDEIDILFINPPFHARNGGSVLFPLGLGYIISAVKNSGFSYKVLDLSTSIGSLFVDDLKELKEVLRSELQKYLPRLVGIGPCITTHVKALKIISDCCREFFDSETIFAGGPLASIKNQEWVFFDYLRIDNIVKGDGEEAVVEAISLTLKGEPLSSCDKISTKEQLVFNEIADINTIAFPDRALSENDFISVRRRSTNLSVGNTAPIITSRGCNYSCNYCVSGNIPFMNFRKRSFENIIGEIIHLKNKYGINDIIFYDDCFFSNAKTLNNEISEFCGNVMESQLTISWQMELRPDLLVLLDEKTLFFLEESGCRQINVGIEKTTTKGLEYLGKASVLHELTDKIAQIKDCSRIKISGTFILGGLDEGRVDILREIKNSIGMNLDFAHYNPLFLYPGTPLGDSYFLDEKEWLNTIISDPMPWGEIVYENKYIGKEELLELIEIAYHSFYTNSEHSCATMFKDRFNLRRWRGV